MKFPVPETDGEKTSPLTPEPDHTPPAGVNPFSVSATAFIQMLKPVPAFTEVGEITVTIIESLELQPVPGLPNV